MLRASPSLTPSRGSPPKWAVRHPSRSRLNPDIDAKTHVKTTTGKRGNKFGMDIDKAAALANRVLGRRAP